jgi:hypothetical protein
LKTPLLFLLFPILAFSDPLATHWPNESITLPSGDGSLSLETSYMNSDHFYDANGNRTLSTTEDYYDVLSTVHAVYGLTNNWSLWFSFPVVYRTERKTLNAKDWGVGDVETGARYRFFANGPWGMEAAGGFEARLPSGETDISLANELPLGTGDTRLTPKVLMKLHPTPNVSVGASVGYTFRMDATVEYLWTDPLPASDGLPRGNLNIDWGDELHARTETAWRILPWLSIGAGGNFMLRQPTTIRSFVFAPTASGFDSVPVTFESNTSWILSVLPSILFRASDRATLAVSADIPVLGNSHTVLPLAESLVGNRYIAEVRYAF